MASSSPLSSMLLQCPSSSSSSPCSSGKGSVLAVLQAPRPKFGGTRLRLGKLQTQTMEELKKVAGTETLRRGRAEDSGSVSDSLTIAKLWAIAEAVADRAEMHDIIGEQRADWNKLLLNCINAMILTAATMTGIAAGSSPALTVSSTLLFSAAAALLLVVNKIQPSQLAEEQRNAARLFRQLHRHLQTILAAGHPSPAAVDEAVDRVLALEKAYPLPLLPSQSLPGMLDKFPKKVQPTVWWPPQAPHLKTPTPAAAAAAAAANGWSLELEEELTAVQAVLRKIDIPDYVHLSKLVLRVNKALAVAGPVLACGATIAAALGSPWAAVAAALAAAVNTVEHGGQVGMVFEMYRNCAGFYTRLEESIDWSLQEEVVQRRENGEVFEMKMALQLGRSVSELRELAAAASSSSNEGRITESAGKLF